MPLFRKNHEKAKSLRQQLVEEESGCRIAMLTKQTTIRGEIVEERHAWMIASIDYGASAEKSHPGIQAFVHGQEGKEYASLDSALCALEKALYGFDLSGRMERAEEKPDPQPAPEEPKAKLPNPSVTIEFLGEGADPKVSSVRVRCDRVGFDGGDPAGVYGSIEKAIGALDEAIADPYAKKKGGKSKKAKR